MIDDTVALEIPRSWLEGVSDEPLTLQHIFRAGLLQYKLTRAIQLYKDGVGSLGYIAEQLQIPKDELVREARLRGIEPLYTEQTVQEEVN